MVVKLQAKSRRWIKKSVTTQKEIFSSLILESKKKEKNKSPLFPLIILLVYDLWPK